MSLMTQAYLLETYGVRLTLDELADELGLARQTILNRISNGTLHVRTYFDGDRFADVRDVAIALQGAIAGRPATKLEALAADGAALPSADDIVVASWPVPASCGYFLLKAGVVVYVGQTRVGLKRIGMHHAGKDFDAVSVLPCEPERLLGLLVGAVRVIRHGQPLPLPDTPQAAPLRHLRRLRAAKDFQQPLTEVRWALHHHIRRG